MICADGLSGMKEAINAAFPQTELQRCIVHQVRNTLKYVGAKNKKEFANDLKTIYHAPSEDAALKQLERVTDLQIKVKPQFSEFTNNSQDKKWHDKKAASNLKKKQPDEKIRRNVTSHSKPDSLWHSIFAGICLQQRFCRNNNAFLQSVS